MIEPPQPQPRDPGRQHERPLAITLTDVLDVAGIACLLVAAFAVDWRLGLALVGVLLLAISYVSSRP